MMNAPRHRLWAVQAIARGCALFLGGYALVSVAGQVRSWAGGGSFDPNALWIALPFVGHAGSAGLLAVAGATLVSYAIRPRMARWRRGLTLVCVVALAAVAVWNGIGFYQVWRAGEIHPGVPLPLSFVLAAVLLLVAWGAAGRPAPGRRRWAAPLVLVCTAGACALLFPLAQVFFFGETDYRRDASVAVVFGAQVHDNGRPSTSLLDRMNRAVELYDDGLVDTLLVSGGVGDSGYNEAEVMRDMAVAAGVPRDDIIVDGEGVNTAATIRNSLALLDARSSASSGATAAAAPTIIAVSHFYHLPRIKLAYARAGREVCTVPSATSPIPQTKDIIVRELAAFWAYYLRAVVG